MSKVQEIIQEIRELQSDDLQKVLKEILAQMDKLQIAKKSLDQFAGTDKGVWGSDAQNHVDSLRSKDRV